MATITGTDGQDRLVGTTGDDVITALGGNDIIVGSPGADTVDGGAASDILQFGFSAALGAGPEPGGSRLITVTGSRTEGGRVTDTSGRFNTQFIDIESMSFSNSGSYGLTVDATASRGIVLNLFGSDASTAVQRLVAGAGNDRLNASRGLLDIDAGAGIDSVSVATTGPTAAIQTTTGAIELHRNGSDGALLAVIANAEQYYFYAANPTTGAVFDASALTIPVELGGTGENDQLIGGSGNDGLQMRGSGRDADLLSGGIGADTYYAISFRLLAETTRIADFEGHDLIDFSPVAASGFPENKPQYMGTGAFSGVAGEYRSTIAGRHIVIEVDADGDTAADSRVVIGDRGLILRETSEGSNILEVDAGAGLRIGTLSAESLAGNAASDFLYGYDGDDRLNGGAGDDLLEGGRGADLMRGGTGADIFLFDLAEDGTGSDRILDFGRDDILVTTEALFDGNADGRIDFGRNRVLDFLAFDGDAQGQVVITGESGARITSLEFNGFVDLGDIRYYVYSRVGSSTGTQVLAASDFADLLG